MKFAVFVLAPIIGELIALKIREYYFKKENEKRVISLLSLRKDVIHSINFWHQGIDKECYAKGRYDSYTRLLEGIDKEIDKGWSNVKKR